MGDGTSSLGSIPHSRITNDQSFFPLETLKGKNANGKLEEKDANAKPKDKAALHRFQRDVKDAESNVAEEFDDGLVPSDSNLKPKEKVALHRFQRDVKDAESNVAEEFDDDLTGKERQETIRDSNKAAGAKKEKSIDGGIKGTKALHVGAKVDIDKGDTKVLKSLVTDPDISELETIRQGIILDIGVAKEITDSMEKFFLSPLLRDMTLRIMSLFVENFAQEFSTQMNMDILKTKAKIASIKQQAGEIADQANLKLASGIMETVVTGASAGISLGGAIHGTKSFKANMSSSEKNIKGAISHKEGLLSKQADSKVKIDTNKKELLRLKSEGKVDSPEYKQTQAKLTKAENDLKDTEFALPISDNKLDALRSKRDQSLRSIDMQVAQINSLSQVVGSLKGIINGGIEYAITLKQSYIKLMDADQAGIQLAKDNARMFAQRANEAITSALNSMLAIVNSIYQTRRGIVTS